MGRTPVATGMPVVPRWSRCLTTPEDIWFPIVRQSQGHDYCDYFCCTLMPCVKLEDERGDPPKSPLIIQLGDIVSVSSQPGQFFITLIWTNKIGGR